MLGQGRLRKTLQEEASNSLWNIPERVEGPLLWDVLYAKLL